ncbi:AraC family transcriptional regulator [Sutterella sp.]|uniref:AraC family transcriptional regulator n=1 Tax=Sutterella sp. TaxID=1981025 RepID=UPI0026E05A0A|nr:AraC family transcriptional regulator [Sutterella sp.]MDO5532924.1 AraC family transcriptional regulator [Sutterella sp.]
MDKDHVNHTPGTDFPWRFADVTIDPALPGRPDFRLLPRLDDLQFLLVLEGSLELRTAASQMQMRAGEAVFINRGTVHDLVPAGRCRYRSFTFPEHFLTFYEGSPAKAFVERVTRAADIPFIHFTGHEPWHSRIVVRLEMLAETERLSTEFHDYEILSGLTGLWLDMIRMTEVPAHSAGSGEGNERMGRMLAFIDAHCAEEITPENLATAAGVTEAECVKCFRRATGTTPGRYLTEFRLAKAAELLSETDMPVARVGEAVGIGSPSHFGRCFREKTGHTPREWRQLFGRK